MNADFRNEDFDRTANMRNAIPQEPIVVKLGVPDASTPNGQAPRRHHTVLKVLGIVLASAVMLSIVLGILFVGIVTLGISSCVASISDDPIGDSPETMRFIEKSPATKRDLTTFDALRGSLDSLYERCATQAERSREDGHGRAEQPLSIDDLRAQVAAGSWPSDAVGYGDPSSSTSPQLWVRLAELAQDWLEQRTNESWRVIDFAYPIPNNGPIPVPPKRDESDCASTVLLCTKGIDKGLYVEVHHYRWQTPARWETSLDEARTQRDETLAINDGLTKVSLLVGHQFIASSGTLVIWEASDSDPLRDPDIFAAFANELKTSQPSIYKVVLLASDTPVILSYDPISYNYPNEQPLKRVGFNEAYRLIPLADGRYSLDFAQGDEMLEAHVGNDEDVGADDLEGALAPSPQDDYLHPWVAPDEDASADDALTQVVQQVSGTDGTDSIIAISSLEVTPYNDATTTSWVLVPRGILPENSSDFCKAINDLIDRAWRLQEPRDDGRMSLYVHIYVIDEDSIRDEEGNTLSFAELRDVAQKDPSQLDTYTFASALTAMPSATRWEDEAEVSFRYCEKRDVGGSVSRSREWTYEGLDL